MPPITDPNLLAEIQRQQQMQAPPVAPMPFPGALPPLRPAPTQRKTEQDIQQDAVKFPKEVSKLDVETDQARAQTKKTEQDVELNDLKKQEHDRAVKQALDYQRGVLKSINEARGLVSGWSTGFGGYLKDIPATDAKALANALIPISSNTAFERLQNTRALSPTGGSATGQTSDFEQKMLMNSIAGIQDQTQRGSDLLKHLDTVELHFYRSLAEGQGKPLPNTIEEGRKLFPELAPPPQEESPRELSTTYKEVKLPAGYASDLSAFLASRPPGKLTVDDYMAFRKAADAKYSTEDLPLQSDPDIEANKKFVDAYNAGKPYENEPKLLRPLNPIETIGAEAAQSPAGTALANAANAALAGVPEMLAGKDEMKLLGQKNPTAAVVGEVVGSVLPITGLEAGIARGLKAASPLLEKAGIRGARYADNFLSEAGKTARERLAIQMAANAGYGGARGATGAEPGQRGEGALVGAAVGGLSAPAATAVASGARGFTQPATDKALDLLKGVDLTTFQRMGLGGVDRFLKGVPGIHGAIERSFQSFNKDNAQRALNNIGVKLPKKIEPGVETNAFVADAFSKAYSDIRPKVVGQIDRPFQTAYAAIKTANSSTPEMRKGFSQISNAIKNFSNKGAYDGNSYQATSEALRTMSKDFYNIAEQGGNANLLPDQARQLGRAADQARKQIQALVSRNSPEVATKLKGIERGYAHLVRIEEASKQALKNNEAVYSPSQYVGSTVKFDSTARRSASARGRALDQDYALAAQKILGSGGPGNVNLLSTSAAGGAGIGGMLTAPQLTAFLGAAATGVYAPYIKRFTQAVLAGKRPTAIDNRYVKAALADWLREQKTGE